MAYIANKPVRFDKNYGIGETIPDNVIDPKMEKRLIAWGKIIKIENADNKESNSNNKNDGIDNEKSDSNNENNNIDDEKIEITDEQKENTLNSEAEISAVKNGRKGSVKKG